MAFAAFPLRAEVDNTFNCILGHENGEVRAMARQADGKILIGGVFTSVKGVPRYAIARLLPTGAVDTGFDAGIVLGNVYAIAVQANGQIVIGGDFNTVNGATRAGITRLNADGSLDTSFNSSAAASTVNAVALQPDGAILVGGYFSTVNGVSRSRIARLLANGTLDTSFNPGAGLSGSGRFVNAFALQTDGKILVGGAFTKYDNTNRQHLARVNADGTLDTSFDPLDQVYDYVFSLIAQADGKIVATGYKYCRRLMPDGKSLDPTFIEPDTGIGADAAEVRMAAALPDGGYAIGGKFWRVGNHYNLAAAACLSNTYLAVGDAVFYGGDNYDPSRFDLLKFTNQTGLRASPLTGVASGNNTVVEVGRSSSVFVSSNLAEWATVATDVLPGFNNVVFTNNTFLAVGGSGVIRLSTDNGATWQSPANSPTSASLYGAAGNGSNWVAVGGTTGSGVILYSSDGSTWNVATNSETNILYSVVHGGGTFVAVGENSAIWASTNGQNWGRVTNVFTNTLYGIAYGGGYFAAVGALGAIVVSSDGSTWTNGYNYSTQRPLQPLRGITFANTKFFAVGGYGTVLISDPRYTPPRYFMDRTLADNYRNCAALLDSNGVVRTNFASGINDLVSNYPEVVHALLPETNGVLVAGNFVKVNLTNFDNVISTNAGDVARLNRYGTLDTSFDIGMGVGGGTPPSAIFVQPDGKVLLGGDFTSVNGVSRNRIARVNADGTLDTSFDPGIGADRAVYCIDVHANGKIVFGGIINTPYRPVARLHPDGSTDTTFNPGIGLAFNDTITALRVQADEKVLLNGSAARILRLNADGTTDTSFTNNLGAGLKGGFVNSIALQPDGKILLGGTFTNFNNRAAYRLARLLPSGTNDDAFSAALGLGANTNISVVAVQTNGLSSAFSILIGGAFTNFNGAACGRITRLDEGGLLDGTFSADATNVTYLVPVWDDSAGESLIYVAGNFTNFNGVSRVRLARLRANGQLDAAFNSGPGPDNYPTALAVQPDLKTLFGGAFKTADGGRWPNLARFKLDGLLAQWRNGYFTAAELSDLAVSGDSADPDADGVANLAEYAFNMNPKNSVRAGAPVAAVQTNATDGKKYAVLIYHRRTGSAGVQYLLDIADTLPTWQTDASRFEEISAVSDGNGLTETVTVRIKPAIQDTPIGFVRMRVQGQ
ncbi:MAG: delta-60 repeat domain-containing protein [Verrucomicrobia bacterium]|nr:delta-60 repeat domain-containing protein [Verrucomicrobiota bacterium]